MVTAQHTLEELARTVNRLIEERPEQTNPVLLGDDAVCVYHETDTDRRCLIGQALFEMTGLNVPESFEGAGIYELLQTDEFCDYFGLPYDTHINKKAVFDGVFAAQAKADRYLPWGALMPINVADV